MAKNLHQPGRVPKLRKYRKCQRGHATDEHITDENFPDFPRSERAGTEHEHETTHYRYDKRTTVHASLVGTYRINIRAITGITGTQNLTTGRRTMDGYHRARKRTRTRPRP